MPCLALLLALPAPPWPLPQAPGNDDVALPWPGDAPRDGAPLRGSATAETGFWLRLEGRGLDLDAGYVFDVTPTPRGATRSGRADRGLFDVSLEVDLERAVGLAGATAFAQFYSQAGRNGSSIAGDIQGYSNLDADNVAQLAELWYEQTLLGGALRFKVGKLDANSEYALVDAGGEFLSSSAGFSPTIHAFPTYPDPAVSVNAFVHPTEQTCLSLGVFNAEDGGAVPGYRGLTADFDEEFLIGELSHQWGPASDGGAGRGGIGGWRHTGEFARFDGGTEDGAGGTYAFVEHDVFREVSDGKQGLTLFAQLGFANAAVSEIERHVAVGAVYSGLVPGRDDERTGLYVSQVKLTDEPGAGLGGHELAIELIHTIRLRSWLTLKPDLQLIVDPAGREDVDDVLVGTLRLELF